MTDIFLQNGRLGRKAVVHDSRTLQFRKYLTPALPPPPPSCDWTKGLSQWGMMLNDKLGDCTIAGCGHAEQVWSLNSSKEITVTDQAILTAYEQWDGYNPNDPSSDQGGIELEVLKNWRKLGLAGHQLRAFAEVDVSNTKELQQAITLFGCAYIGVALPITAQNQLVWDVVNDHGSGDADPGSWGGHCVILPKYAAARLCGTRYWCITWGGLKEMTDSFVRKYVDEAYALFGADWINSGGVAPSGFNAAQLTTDLTQFA